MTITEALESFDDHLHGGELSTNAAADAMRHLLAHWKDAVKDWGGQLTPEDFKG